MAEDDIGVESFDFNLVLGVGGFGTVYLAKKKDDGRFFFFLESLYSFCCYLLFSLGIMLLRLSENLVLDHTKKLSL